MRRGTGVFAFLRATGGLHRRDIPDSIWTGLLHAMPRGVSDGVKGLEGVCADHPPQRRSYFGDGFQACWGTFFWMGRDRFETIPYVSESRHAVSSPHSK